MSGEKIVSRSVGELMPRPRPHKTDEARLKPVRRGDSVDEVVRRIREGILKGQFAQGQRLIARDLTTALGFSRGTLREAFGHLASEGLVELVPNRGAIVRRLSRREIVELFQIRELLEGLSARLAAEAVAAQKRRKSVEAIRSQIDPRVGLDQFHAQNLLVHGSLVDLGGSRQLAQLMAKMNVPFVMGQVRQSMGKEQIARSQQEHIAVLKAVEMGDPDAAEAAMRQHLRNTGEWVMQLPDEAFRTEVLGSDRR